MKRLVLISLGLLVALSSPIPAKATELGLDFTGTTANSFLAELTFGWSFTANQTILVDGLGFFDDELRTGPDLNQDHLVSLWTDDGTETLLAQTTITNASTPVASTAEGGEWLFNNIAPVVLAPGQYVIGAFDPGCTGTADCDDIRFLDTATTSPLITFGEARDASGNAFPNRSNPLRNDGYFGPNLRIRAFSVAEPASVTFLVLGLAAVGVARRRARRS
jgi:hypothetical protein